MGERKRWAETWRGKVSVTGADTGWCGQKVINEDRKGWSEAGHRGAMGLWGPRGLAESFPESNAEALRHLGREVTDQIFICILESLLLAGAVCVGREGRRCGVEGQLQVPSEACAMFRDKSSGLIDGFKVSGEGGGCSEQLSGSGLRHISRRIGPAFRGLLEEDCEGRAWRTIRAPRRCWSLESQPAA